MQSRARYDLGVDQPDGFTNEPIDVAGLPTLADHTAVPLDPAYQRLRTLTALAAATVAAIGVILLAVTSRSWSVAAVGAGVVLLILVVGVLHHIEVVHMGYLVREHDVTFWSGVIGRSVATAPFARVQHVSIGRGPLERWAGLATLQLRTAGGQVAIPGLSLDVAERLKQLVADRAAELAEAEIDGDAA